MEIGNWKLEIATEGSAKLDPTAPKDNNPQDPNAPKTPPSPIQPGQFIVAGEEDVFKEPPPPASPTSSQPPSAQDLQFPRTTGSGEAAAPPQDTLGVGNLTGSLALSTNTEPQPSVPAPAPQPQPQVNQPIVNITPSVPPFDQPNPTPYEPPPASPTSQPAQPSIISKLKKLLIILIVLIILSAVAAAVWFFLLGKTKIAQNRQVPEEKTEVEAPASPLPKRTTGGFADLPIATQESQATQPAQVVAEEEEESD